MSLVKRIGLVIALAFSLFVGSAAGAQAAEICVPPLVCATVTLPAPDPITIRVPGPTVKVPGPRVTVTDTVTLPRQTVTQKVPQVVSTTDIVRLPAQTVTKTVRENGQTGQTATKRATVTETQTVTRTITPEPTTTTVTKTVSVTRVVHRGGGVITVERVQAAGISVGLLLLGAALGLLAMYITYIVGYKDSELENEKAAENLLTELFSRKK